MITADNLRKLALMLNEVADIVGLKGGVARGDMDVRSHNSITEAFTPEVGRRVYKNGGISRLEIVCDIQLP